MAKPPPKNPPPGEKTERSQLMELFLGVAAELGFTADDEIGRLADVGPENVVNWRTGKVSEFKPQRLRAALSSLSFHIQALRAQAGMAGGAEAEELALLEIEHGSSPADLHRQFRDRVNYDYLGHRFLYFEPQGAHAWENLIKEGYDQDRWLAGVGDCATEWLNKGPLERALGAGAVRQRPRGLDFVSLGSGEGLKDMLILRALLAAESRAGRLAWVTYAPVDVSIPLLMTAARAARRLLAAEKIDRIRHWSVLPYCADFEEGSLAFQRRLRTTSPAFAAEGVRLCAILGNVFGNVRDEETFVRKKLSALVRPGDLAWIEVGVRPDDLGDDPLFHMTRPGHQESAGEANRRLLLEGPYRRFASATGRAVPEIDLRISLREGDDACRVAGSVNFVHDLVIKDERRSCTMLYSRRYRVAELTRWFERLGWVTEGTHAVADSRHVPRVAHVLLRRV
jgi:hypothetical protein